jgi:hypothetical protein
MDGVMDAEPSVVEGTRAVVLAEAGTILIRAGMKSGMRWAIEVSCR